MGIRFDRICKYKLYSYLSNIAVFLTLWSQFWTKFSRIHCYLSTAQNHHFGWCVIQLVAHPFKFLTYLTCWFMWIILHVDLCELNWQVATRGNGATTVSATMFFASLVIHTTVLLFLILLLENCLWDAPGWIPVIWVWLGRYAPRRDDLRTSKIGSL